MRSSRHISAEIALPLLQSEIVVALFPFASRSFLANNLRFKVKVIEKAIVINVKIRNERKRLYFHIEIYNITSKLEFLTLVSIIMPPCLKFDNFIIYL
jgi:hypothetical protein